MSVEPASACVVFRFEFAGESPVGSGALLPDFFVVAGIKVAPPPVIKLVAGYPVFIKEVVIPVEPAAVIYVREFALAWVSVPRPGAILPDPFAGRSADREKGKSKFHHFDVRFFIYYNAQKFPAFYMQLIQLAVIFLVTLSFYFYLLDQVAPRAQLQTLSDQNCDQISALKLPLL